MQPPEDPRNGAAETDQALQACGAPGRAEGGGASARSADAPDQGPEAPAAAAAAARVLCGKPEPRWIEAERWAGLLVWLVLALSSAAGLTYTLWIDPRGWAPGAALAAALALLLLGVWFWVRPPKLYARLSYRLDPLGLSIESGRLWRRWTFVPRQRVQFVDLVSGPIDQRFGLADLVLHTAGSEAAEVRLPGLSREVAEALRAELLTGLEREPR